MNILFVCTGNTCRSPIAQGYLDYKKPEIYVKSRGLSANGESASENAIKAMAEKGIDIKDHLSAPLSTSDLLWADKVICLSQSHKTAVNMFTDPQKVFVLGDGISDPFGGDIDTYRKCRDEIFAAIDNLIDSGFFSEVYVSSIKREHIAEIAKLEKICFSEPWSEEVLLDSFMKGTKFFVCLTDRKVAGYVGISCVLDEGYITNIAVFPEYRKKGIATMLLERIFSLAKDEGLSFVSLEVRESNFPAISLYEKLGFKTEGRRPNFYSNPTEAALIMTKRFD